MSFGTDIRIEEDMSEAVEGGAAIAWRLLATLEGGSLLLVTSALFVYTVRKKIARQNRRGRHIRRVLVTNTTNLLGRELKKELQARGCSVEEVDHSTRRSSNGAARRASKRKSKVDAIIIVGAEHQTNSLDGIANQVSEDIYENLKALKTHSCRVERRGRIAWASVRPPSPDLAGSTGCAAGAENAYSRAAAAFDDVLRSSLLHYAKLCHCEPIWVGRCDGAECTASRVVDALLARKVKQATGFSLRNAAKRVGECLYRWLKIVT